MTTARLSADTLLVNGAIRTLDPSATVASALAVHGDRIVGVGSADELRPLTDRRTRVMDLGGRTVLPGLIDAHTHFQSSVVARAFSIDWEGHKQPRTLATVLEDVRRRAASLRPGEWVRGDGIASTRLAERRMPTRWELDAVAPDNPVVLIGGAAYSISANSRALQIAGISRETVDPPGGRIERDEHGDPTGVLIETAKLRLNPSRLDTVLPTYSPEQRLEPLKASIREVHAEGITTVHDMVAHPEEIAAWIRLRRAGELQLRVQMIVRGIQSRTPLKHLIALGLETGLGDEWLRFGGVKMSIDGVCAYRSAAVFEPYPGQPENLGILRIPPDEVEAGIAQCHQNGIRLSVHTVGQRAVDVALDAFERAFGGRGCPDRRHRLEHVHLPPRPGQLERIAALGLTVCAQPTFVWKHGDAWYDIWGEDGTQGIMPLRRMLDAGITVFGGTDFPGTPISPFMAFKAAVARRTRDGRVLDPRDSITIDEVLRMWTIGAAYGGFEEHLKGSLEVGKLADLIVVSEDPYAVSPDELDHIKVDLTMVGGNVVFTRE